MDCYRLVKIGIKREIINIMKKKILFLVSFCSVGLLFLSSTDLVSASEINSDHINSIITTENGVTITETIVPNEFADEWEEEHSWKDSSEKISEDNLLVPTAPEKEFTTFGASPPLFTYWNVATSGRYTYSGSFSSSSALYTNKAIKGAKSYYVSAKNTGSKKVGFEARDRTSLYRSTTLLVGATHYFSFSMTSTSNSFYLKFFPVDGASSVSGYIQKN